VEKPLPMKNETTQLDCKKGNVLFICSPANLMLFVKKAMLWEGAEKRLDKCPAAFFVLMKRKKHL
jgi:hypothetical protein